MHFLYYKVCSLGNGIMRIVFSFSVELMVIVSFHCSKYYQRLPGQQIKLATTAIKNKCSYYRDISWNGDIQYFAPHLPTKHATQANR